MGTRRNVLDSQAIRDFEDMRLQHAGDAARWPRYDVEVDDEEETVRRAAGTLLVDILTVEALDTASRPPGPGEEFTLRDLLSASWRTDAEEQREMAGLGYATTHKTRAELRGSYADVVRALVASLAHHGLKLLVVAESPTSARLTAHVARPWYGGVSGRMWLEIVPSSAGSSLVEVDGSTECKGTRGTWFRGDFVLRDTIAGADALLQGGHPAARRADLGRVLEVARPRTRLQWVWLVTVLLAWSAVSALFLSAAGETGDLVVAIAVIVFSAVAGLVTYLSVMYRHL